MLVTALYEDDARKSYYAGIIAEPPSVRNNFRSVIILLVALIWLHAIDIATVMSYWTEFDR